MAKLLTWGPWSLFIVISFFCLVRAMTTTKFSTSSVLSRPISEEEKQAVRNNPALVNFVVDPDSIPWGRQNSPSGNGDEGIRSDTALPDRYERVLMAPFVYYFQVSLSYFCIKKCCASNVYHEPGKTKVQPWRNLTTHICG